jgi:hypothetical protein
LHHLQHWDNVETGCVRNGQGGFQLHYVTFDKLPLHSTWNSAYPANVQNVDAVHSTIERVLHDYDFILIQERLEESLVALQLLLGLHTTDILSMPLHTGGSYLFDRHAGCLELFSPPTLPHLRNPVSTKTADSETVSQSSSSSSSSPPLTKALDEYLQSPQWYAQNYGDYVLWGAANASLDRTIGALGQHAFDEALQDFRELQQQVVQVCSKQVVFPCSPNGTIQREDYQLGTASAAGDRYPQQDIEACIDQVVGAATASRTND